MNNIQLLSIVRGCKAARCSTQQSNIHDTTWTWVPGVIIQPEMLCPFCKQPIKTVGYIWKVALVSIPLHKDLYGQFKCVQGGQFRLKLGNHPHAYSDGRMCRHGMSPQHALCSISSDHGVRGDGRVAFEYLIQWLRDVCEHGPCPANPIGYGKNLGVNGD